MIDNFGLAVAAIRELKSEGVVSEYAIGGAMAFAFWSEPTATFDLDVFVLLQLRALLARLARVGALLDDARVDRALLNTLLQRFALELPK